jgi:ferredoxin
VRDLIDAFKCTECVGAHDEPQCQPVCPVDNCIVPDPDFRESKEELLEKYEQLNG